MKANLALTLLVLLEVGYPAFVMAVDKAVEVKGKAVVFFSPTEKEYNSLSENDQNEWSEVLSDFYHYRDNSLSFLEAHQIKPIITSSSKIIIRNERRTRTYLRKRFKHIVGYILTDGSKEPKVVEGFGTDIDLVMDFQAYFNIK